MLNLPRCYCGNELQNNAGFNQTGCSMPCSGDASKVCGGANRLSVYTNKEFFYPTVREVHGNYVSLGCFKEGKTERALGGLAFRDPAMTPELCINGCEQQGFGFAGVEYATECYCSNLPSNQTMHAPIGECNMLCAGNKKTFCGGSDRLIVYSDLTKKVIWPHKSVKEMMNADQNRDKGREQQISPTPLALTGKWSECALSRR